MSSMTQKVEPVDGSSDSEQSFINVLDERPVKSSADAPFDDMIGATFARLQDIIATKNSVETELNDLFAKRRTLALEELEKARRRLEFVDQEERQMKDVVKEDCFKQSISTVASDTSLGRAVIPPALSKIPFRLASCFEYGQEERRTIEEKEQITTQEAKMMATIEEYRAVEAKKADVKEEGLTKEETKHQAREEEEQREYATWEEQTRLQYEQDVAEELPRIAEEEKSRAEEEGRIAQEQAEAEVARAEAAEALRKIRDLLANRKAEVERKAKEAANSAPPPKLKPTIGLVSKGRGWGSVLSAVRNTVEEAVQSLSGP